MNDRLENTSCKNPTLASEIIADQQQEIESLKAELQRLKTENPDRIDRNKIGRASCRERV